MTLIEQIVSFWPLIIFGGGIIGGVVRIKMQVTAVEKDIEAMAAEIKASKDEETRNRENEFARLSAQIEKMDSKLSTVAEDVARINGRLGASKE